MRRLLLCILLLFIYLTAHSTHIVGGELVFKALPAGGSASHRVGLNLYFDQINGSPQAEDQFVNLFFFQTSDNRRIGSVQVPKVSRKNITYTNPECGNSGLRTLFITYSLDILLNASDFSDPGGYYIVWDRCCRNNVIDNIRTPGDVGSLFFLHFPPLTKNGSVFRNSAPEFGEVQGDYACINADYYLDFGATDADGDSLVYSLTTPLTGYSSRTVPSPQPVGTSNYPTVLWVDGISLNNAIPGIRPLRINAQTGRLSVTANKLGLFVFSVRVSEYRKGELIGSVTRDFQLKVIECFEAFPPKILVVQNSKKEQIKNNSVIRLTQRDSACFTVQVTDPNFNQLIRVKGRAVNSNRSDFFLLPSQFRTRKSNDTLSFQFCLDDCFITDDNRPIRLDLIAEDESCPVPLTDTLHLTIYRQGTPNAPPTVSTSLEQPRVSAIPDQLVEFDVLGKDTDPDSILLSASGVGFSLDKYGFSFPPVRGKGDISQVFSWKPPCTLSNSDTIAVDFRITDLRCGTNSLSNTTRVFFALQQSLNNPPKIRTTLPKDTVVIQLNPDLPEQLIFDVIANDLDTTQLSLFGIGRGFSMGEAGMDFLNRVGVREVLSPFAWVPDCSLLGGKSERLFALDFICEDKSCQAARDTSTIFILIKDRIAESIVKLPNVITPNQDGKNDCFDIQALPLDNCNERFEELLIYNRWGGLVYRTSDRTQDWCPLDAPMGTYFYQIRYSIHQYKGTLNLLK
ncbi:T9SS type B sorting domain-containing protein [Salmonirosea aquatica]|uniref:Gliding motility-associated C-terminal domain-containing protein n=1 Tax=Salmonirosea aquatica TaxID=2654236 RepID=A0A7C9FQ75_9BACT|nr:gliding motility-associated C-terminal domain-containing protein [Cytophagaceae bacterium SJW1-29]